jgi:hypothetical protein
VLAIAVLLLAATLLRRWYLMGAAGAFVAMGADQAYLAVRARRLGLAVRRLAVAAIIPLTFAALFALVAWPYVHQLLVADYASAYSSFKVHDGYLDLAGRAATRHFGLLYLAPVIIGWFVLALTRAPGRVAGLVVVGAAVVSFFVVGRIQSFSPNHYYLLTPAVLIGLAAAVAGSCRRAPHWTMAGTGALVLYAALFVGAYHPVTIGGLAPRATAPAQRSDTSELVRLYDDLATRQVGKHSIYVLVCSDRLNKSVLLDLPLVLPTSGRVAPSAWMPSPDLDLRDGFNHAFFNARWVVDADPPGYIAADPTHQSVVTLLHEAVQPGGALDGYYRVRMTYQTEGGQAILLERTSDVPPAVRELILDRVRTLHAGAVAIW